MIMKQYNNFMGKNNNELHKMLINKNKYSKIW